ncbi:hydroxymethylglutaryl-CoA lyase [Mesorhizobium sp. M7A.F.Ca.CA.004.06.1.1]|uniref:hydroxymethylglutaryl-CoA lyase n=1 Tax=Mesorhizobium sp. M7A.F.Ca.CA.004.06.1.1 TaxID=2496686 RepID=UPI000FCA8C0D|nr:hydroxymethylglutaryl-CoA lyase [Mesorhizobium sp. M7A.F.Ca.CA.004.06.1.1]RVB71162.1 hydroxymethylglutaryl-CoA lyase [Mesorhizobium sp. M7A.F.Ca.CA.004.06.1.1]
MGPGAGLQNEKRLVPTAEKIRLVDLLSDCGFQMIEATSFVSPRWVPQMADAAEVMAGIRRAPGAVYAVLVPNMKGYEAARAAKAGEVAVFASASETFSRRNINCSIAESLERFRPVLAAAAADGIPVRGYVSCITDCSYEGPIQPAAAVKVVTELLDMGCYEISLGDTTGQGTPATIAAMLDAVLEAVPAGRLAGHYHDTGGRALDNILVSLEKGLRTFDAAVGGLGGCPFAVGANGNVDTLAVAAMLAGRGYETCLDMERLEEVARFAGSLREERP